MINTVLFDLGNVVLPFDVMRLAGRLTKHTHLSTQNIVDLLWNDHIAANFETGRMPPTDYFAHISAACQFRNLSYEEFIPLFNEIFDEDSGVADLVGRLKNNYKLGLISNTNAIHVDHILNRYPVLSHFECHIWSNKAGVRKPDPAIFNLALSYFSIAPEEAVFIDDLHVNVSSARAIGMNAIHFQGLELLKEELNKLGVRH